MKQNYMHYYSKTVTPETWVTQTYPTGWVCPKCGRVYSPMTPCCWYCGDANHYKITTTSSGEKIPRTEWKDCGGDVTE